MQHPAFRDRSQLSFEERFAERVRDSMGSLPFILWQTVITAIWVALNITGFAFRWDPYPFILLNLMFSVQAAYASPFILLAQKRADIKASELAQHAYETGERDYQTDLDSNRLIRAVARHLGIDE